MLLFENDVIYITQGDDAELDITVTTSSGAAYTFQSGDTLKLTVRALPDTTSPIILQRTATTNKFTFSHTDTESVAVGAYSCDIQLDTSDGKKYTIFPTLEDTQRACIKNFRNFIIMPQVTT